MCSRYRFGLRFVLVLILVSAQHLLAQSRPVPSRAILTVPAAAPAAAAPAAAAAAIGAPPPPLTCPGNPVEGLSFFALGGAISSPIPPFIFSFVAPTPAGLSINSATGVIAGNTTAGEVIVMQLQVTDGASVVHTATCRITVQSFSKSCWWAPTRQQCVGAYRDPARNANINTFFSTDGTLSYLNQIKSIYNGASSSATVSADLATLNFPIGAQLTIGTNIQAGSSGTSSVGTGTVPTLSATAAGQATQNMLYGGTIDGSAIFPLFASGADNLGSPGGLGVLLDFVAREGLDVQNFKSGTSTSVTAPPSHAGAQVEGYLQYNSTNLAPGSSNTYAGSVFIGGSYGYSYTSHGYARDYGFGNNVHNGIGQVSAGVMVSGVAKIAVSRAFGPSQTYIDSTSMVQTTVNNFKSWSFGITYQSPPPPPAGH